MPRPVEWDTLQTASGRILTSTGPGGIWPSTQEKLLHREQTKKQHPRQFCFTVATSSAGKAMGMLPLPLDAAGAGPISAKVNCHQWYEFVSEGFRNQRSLLLGIANSALYFPLCSFPTADSISLSPG